MRSKIFILFIICMLALSATDLYAQVKAGSFSVSPNFGYSNFAKFSDYKNVSTYGASIGYNFSDTFGIEATYNTLDTEIKDAGITETIDNVETIITPGGTEVSGKQIRIEGLYYIYTGKKFAPYVAMGIGTLSQEYQGRKFARTNAPAGFGFKYFFTDTIALRADVRGAIQVHYNNILITAGVTFQFGGK